MSVTLFLLGFSLLLEACGNPTPTQSGQLNNGTTAPGTTAKTPVEIQQPKVVRSGTDAQGGKIEFTEPPVANDGVATFLLFETEN